MKKDNDFKFKIGEVVSHKVDYNIHLVILLQQKRYMTNGIKTNWYTCRADNLGVVEMAEIELQPFKESDVSVWRSKVKWEQED